MKYSVLMSVYYKDKPHFLRLAMDSIFSQTLKTDDFVLVCDGPLDDELNKVILDMQNQHGEVLNVIRLDTNVGLGNALNIGLQACKHDLVARMDSDDISRSTRCEKQVCAFKAMPDIGICSGVIEEFSISIDDVETYNVPPETHDQIINYAKKFNPFNHPCVMFKKSEVIAVGSYQDFYLLEDYYLWVRMLINGSEGYNIQEPLLWMRAGSEMYKRRAGWKYIVSQLKLFKFMYLNGFSDLFSCIYSCTMRIIACIVPNYIREIGIKLILRKKSTP